MGPLQFGGAAQGSTSIISHAYSKDCRASVSHYPECRLEKPQRYFWVAIFLVSCRTRGACETMEGSDPESADSSKSSRQSRRSSGSVGRRGNPSSAAIFGGGSREGTSSARMGLYGALSSCAAAVFLQPLDIIKTRQVAVFLSLAETFKRGFRVSLVPVFLQTMVQLLRPWIRELTLTFSLPADFYSLLPLTCAFACGSSSNSASLACDLQSELLHLQYTRTMAPWAFGEVPLPLSFGWPRGPVSTQESAFGAHD